MKIISFLGLLLLINLLACNDPSSKLKRLGEDRNGLQNSFILKGNWIYHDNSSFELIEIRDTNNVMFYSYLNREKDIGEKEESFKHAFYKSDANLGFWDSTHIWIKTDRYRFDYIVRKDSLFEYDKMGIQKVLIRLKSE